MTAEMAERRATVEYRRIHDAQPQAKASIKAWLQGSKVDAAFYSSSCTEYTALNEQRRPPIASEFDCSLEIYHLTKPIDETHQLPNTAMTKLCEVSDETSTNRFPHFQCLTQTLV